MVLATRSPSISPRAGVDPLKHLIQTRAETPGRSDFLYLPLGFFLSLALAGSGRTWPRIMLVTLAGGLSQRGDRIRTILQNPDGGLS